MERRVAALEITQKEKEEMKKLIERFLNWLLEGWESSHNIFTHYPWG